MASVESRWKLWTVAALPIVVAAALRAHGLGWGLPDLFEEATPFFQAWQMWGWGSGRFDPDPGFYRYPSLAFYAHAAAQAAVLVPTRLTGGEEALRDVPVRFLADPAAFLMVGRAVSALFGVGAVAGTFALARRAAGTVAGVAAGLLLAVNAFHVERSQTIEVDAALVCFVAWGLWACLRVLDAPTWRNHVVAGALVGLAASSKYPGALLAFPLLVAHLRSSGLRRWPRALTAGGVALAAFAVTSPFVLLHAVTAWDAVTAERQHMERGHFGSDDVATWRFYAHRLVDRVLGWPLALAALGGAGFLARRRRGPALVLLAFVLVYAGIVASWEMRTERYLLPLLPPLVGLAAALLGEIPPARRMAAAVAGVALLAGPNVFALPRVWARTAPENRTLARQWIEENCPEGSFLVVEAWGPDLLEPEDLWQLRPGARRKFLDLGARPLYAIQRLPVYQVVPELSEGFYDLDLYPDADFFVLSGDVGDRYRKEPQRFRRQLSFYESLERRLRKVAAFEGGGGPAITVFFQPQTAPFARRGDRAGPRPLREGLRRPPPGEASFFRQLGLNYETFAFADEALDAYERALAVSSPGPETAERVGRGIARCLLDRGDREGAVRALRRAAERCADPATRERIRASADRIERGAADAGVP